MRLLTVALALLSLAVAVPASDAVGGVLVAGVGFGETYTPEGQPFCTGSGHPLHVEAVYLPEGKGLLRVDYYPSQSCPLGNGGGMFIGRSSITPGASPPIEFVFACSGSESSGMYCSDTTQFGDYLWAKVGPYNGPGSTVAITFCSPNRCIRGSFTAV